MRMTSYYSFSAPNLSLLSILSILSILSNPL